MEANSMESTEEHLDEDSFKLPAASRERVLARAGGRARANQGRLDAEIETLRKAVETSGEVIFLTNREGLFTYVNPEFTRLYGYEPGEVVGKTTPRILKSGMMTSQEYEQFWNTLLNRRVVTGRFVNRRKGGELVTVEGSANPVIDEPGDIVGFLAIQRDITQRVQAEEKIRHKNRDLATLYAIATTVSKSLDLEQILNDALDEVLQLDMFGGEAKGMVFRLDEERGNLNLIAHRGAPEDHPCLDKAPQIGECLCGLAAQSGQVTLTEDCRADIRHSRQWPEMPNHKDICLPLIVRGDVLGVMNLRLPAKYTVADADVALLGSVADQIGVAIENARLYETLRRQHENLRTLSSQLAEAEETERRRLAQELHDRVGSKLTALGINLNIIRDQMPPRASGEIHTYVAESAELVVVTTRLIRNVMSDLRPPMLDELGLVETLRWYGENLASRTGLKVVVATAGTPYALSSRTENALFRIAQESFNNVAKHSQATEIKVTIQFTRHQVEMMIADDGVGFSSQHPPTRESEKGWGLLIMAERAEAVGGRCRVESDPLERGTRVKVEIPR
jgi:PAS domain S-box-containing protein